ncbi:hypothetical protein GCM10009069_04440 [Algimonas arctica]|uniref:Uncharacterized protein n=1 Tax=Algimonas arctica TaxID=1479486 RepID=A0A8J3CQH2_9PROT|nr:hypothetical protein GCM10009069_04440 [Algimonas arctica]
MCLPSDRRFIGPGALKRREFPKASGEVSESQFTAFLSCASERIQHYGIYPAATFDPVY